MRRMESPRASSVRASKSICVCLPEPSIPSRAINFPRGGMGRKFNVCLATPQGTPARHRGRVGPRARIRAMDDEIKTTAAKLVAGRERLERAASRAGRRAEDITLIAVSKFHPAERIRELYEAGVRHFGENRVQEWESKRAALADVDATWHLIGHLQSNKARPAVRMFHRIDSLESVALAERLERAKKDINTELTEHTEKRAQEKSVAREMLLRVLVEVRLDPGAAKSGVSDDELPALVESVLRLPHLDLRGLMGVP